LVRLRQQPYQDSKGKNMLKNVTQLQHTINDKLYILTCESDSPIADVKECLNEFLNHVEKIEEQIKSNQQMQNSEKECNSCEDKCKTECV
jgi:hypothetical protein